MGLYPFEPIHLALASSWVMKFTRTKEQRVRPGGLVGVCAKLFWVVCWEARPFPDL